MAQSFPILTGVAAPLLRDNVDAMTIAPRTPAEKGGASTQGGAETVQPTDLFAHLRYSDGSEIADFVLNQPDYRQARFLVVGRNFGCGSAREHAVWALCAFGIGCIVAPSFGPLFYGNCFKNRLVPVTLDEAEVKRIAAECAARCCGNDARPRNRELRTPQGRTLAFTLPEFRFRQLIEGLDEIDMTLQQKGAIDDYQRHASDKRPWLFA